MRIILPVVFYIIVLVCFSQEIDSKCCDKIDTKKEMLNSVFDVVLNPPYFGSCDQLVLTKRLSYPCSDKNVNKYVKSHIDSIEFSEKMEFSAIILSTGCIVEVQEHGGTAKSKQSMDIINILSSMPCWIPGKHNGKNVSCKVRISIE